MGLRLSTTAIDFGNQDVGTPVDRTVDVEIQGGPRGANSGPISASISPSGVGFSVSPVGGTAPLTLTVTFSPIEGAQTATLTVTGQGTQFATVALTGTGIAAVEIEQVDGSHLLLKVPDYTDTEYVNNSSSVNGNSVSSYLRLGVFDYDTESPAAQELLAIMAEAGPAKDPRYTEAANPLVEILPGIEGWVFNDDLRVRPQDVGGTSTLTTADDPDHGLTKAQRRAETAKLYARGGWRDHTDGNRLSTTYGDKIEVVRGNYKMIVLGRQDEASQAMGWEASGGHIQDYAPGTMPGASFWLEWIDDPRYHATGAGGDGRKGAWLLVNTTENVYQFARTAGTLREETWGDVIESYVGSENPPADKKAFAIDDDHGTGGHTVDDAIKMAGRRYEPITPPNANDQKGKIRSNPHLIEKTWAERIDSWTGTKDWLIPEINEHTFAEKINGRTGNADHRVDLITDETWAKATTELVDVRDRIESNTRAGNIFEATTAGTIWGATTAASIIELTVMGMHVEAKVGGLHLEMEAGLGHIEIELAHKIDICIAKGYEVKIGDVEEVTMSELRTKLKADMVALKKSFVGLFKKDTAVTNSSTAATQTVSGGTVNVGGGP